MAGGAKGSETPATLLHRPRSYHRARAGRRSWHHHMHAELYPVQKQLTATRHGTSMPTAGHADRRRNHRRADMYGCTERVPRVRLEVLCTKYLNHTASDPRSGEDSPLRLVNQQKRSRVEATVRHLPQMETPEWVPGLTSQWWSRRSPYRSELRRVPCRNTGVQTSHPPCQAQLA